MLFWNHETAQFVRIHSTDEAHLDGYHHVYSHDGKLFACRSFRDSHIRVWDTRTGHLCGKPIIMPGVNEIAFSPVSSMCLPMSSTSHNDHDDFDPDNTLSTSARYDFMNKGILPPLISLNRPQSPCTKIVQRS